MTLTELFNEWAKQPQSAKIAAAYRQAITNVFLKCFGDRDIQTIGPEDIRGILENSDQPQPDKTRAYSALVMVLTYGYAKGYCKKPELMVMQKPEPVEIKVRREALERRVKELKANVKTVDKEAKKKAAKVTKKVRKCNKPKAVVQLDPVTYQPIKTFANAAVAGKAVKSTNVLRAVKERTLSAGYFWAFEDGVKDFKPCDGTLQRRAIRVNHPVPPGITDADIEGMIEELDAASDRLHELEEAMIEDRKERLNILREYTNDELMAEIRVRGWKGNLTIPVNFEL